MISAARTDTGLTIRAERAAKVGARYGGADLRQMYGEDQRRTDVTIRPTRVVPIDLSP